MLPLCSETMKSNHPKLAMLFSVPIGAMTIEHVVMLKKSLIADLPEFVVTVRLMYLSAVKHLLRGILKRRVLPLPR